MNAGKQIESQRAFTLIELLVVISIVVLLLALLLPALSRARNQAQAVVCQGRLRQLGLGLSMWMDENETCSAWGGFDTIWRYVTDPILRSDPDVVLCPSASKPLPGVPGMVGDTFHAYSCLMGRSDLRGSYGLNGGVFTESSIDRSGENLVGPGRWISWHAKCAGRVPVFFDCAMCGACPPHTDEPPEYEGAWTPYTMWTVCINRHRGGINMAFMDGSVRKVGLKELWTLMWSRHFLTTGPWTKTGGVKPEDWPQWMRKFRDY